MYDADGPVIARAVYHKFFQAGGNNVSLDFSSVMTSLAKGFALVMSDPLSESDFDAIARDVVLPSALRGKPFTREVLRASIREIFPMLTAEPVLESDVELIEEVVCELLLQPPLFNFSLPHVVDDIVRYLRDFAKLPPSRWATFIHMGA